MTVDVDTPFVGMPRNIVVSGAIVAATLDFGLPGLPGIKF